MDTGLWFVVLFGVVALGFIATIVFIIRRTQKSMLADQEGAKARQEALFAATFPELQPHFHPERVLQFVGKWRSRSPKPQALDWKDPPGLGAARAKVSAPGEKGQRVELLDPAGAVLSTFMHQEHDDGGVIRLGPGKLTVNLRDAAVRYWHPEREFKWSRLRGFRVISSLSDRGIDSSSDGMSFSSSSSSSSPATTAAAAAAGAAVVTGAGGAFDGGGSSESWDGGSESRTAY